jgi:hypothetical protein
VGVKKNVLKHERYPLSVFIIRCDQETTADHDCRLTAKEPTKNRGTANRASMVIFPYLRPHYSAGAMTQDVIVGNGFGIHRKR